MYLIRIVTLTVLSLVALSINCFGQAGSAAKPAPATFDPALAAKLGADEYGMKAYVIAFLKTGPTKIADEKQRAELMAAHLKNIGRLANDGKLALAGPFIKGGDLRGIFIFNVTTVEEAQKLVETDPAVKAGVFVIEFHPWYGSAALMEVNRIHQQIQKTSITN